MSKLFIKSPGNCRYDAVSLGEVMIRLDPGEERIHTARSFRAWEGGGSTTSPAGCAAALACAPPSSPPSPTIPSAG